MPSFRETGLFDAMNGFSIYHLHTIPLTKVQFTIQESQFQANFMLPSIWSSVSSLQHNFVTKWVAHNFILCQGESWKTLMLFFQFIDHKGVPLLYVAWTITSLGLIFDNNPQAWISEAMRISTFSILFYQPTPLMIFILGGSFLFASIRMYSLSSKLFFSQVSKSLEWREGENYIVLLYGVVKRKTSFW